MYAVVDFADCRNETTFEIIMATPDVEHAKRVAFQIAKKELSKEKDTETSFHKITTKMEDYEYLYPVNKIIVAYKIIELVKYKTGLKIASCNANIYAVVELKKIDITQSTSEIEPSFICDSYHD